jgi:hypothetical protein
MMAIHDIGELMTGDEMTFTKKSDAHIAERKAALEILDPCITGCTTTPKPKPLSRQSLPSPLIK